MSICSVGEKGLFLPIFGDDEQRWPMPARSMLYLVGLLWCFLGVSIIADVFMGAIETVTSKKKQVLLQVGGTQRFVTVKVWNDTVANLTLMALGSSAPEILLSVIELLSASFYSGVLGPSTIVGSAAFNLLCIIAVCVYVIPEGQIRYIKYTSVFNVTALCSMWAYFWLVIILTMSTPNVIDVWEGVMTFLFFPILVVIAYLADRGIILAPKKQNDDDAKVVQIESGSVTSSTMGAQDLEKIQEIVSKERGQRMSVKEVQGLLSQTKEITGQEKVSRAVRRMAATRALMGGKRLDRPPIQTKEEEKVRVQFTSECFQANTCCEEVAVLIVECIGQRGETHDVKVHYRTIAKEVDPLLTAQHGVEYMASEGVCTIKAGSKEGLIKVPLVKSTAPRIAAFAVELSQPKFVLPPTVDKHAFPEIIIGDNSHCKVELVSQKGAGEIRFFDQSLSLPVMSGQFTAKIVVCRNFGSDGEVKCSYRTEKITSVPGYDYVETDGTLVFADHQAKATIPIEILPKSLNEADDQFRVILEDIEGGAIFNKEDDGGEDSCILTVTLVARHTEGQANNVLRWFDDLLNFDEINLGTRNWAEQFKTAIYVNGSPEEQQEATPSDWVAHVLALPWKIVFAFVPPTTYCGGWLCFVIAICFIGFVTAIIGDMAALFGCCAGLPDSITAITFVALGTSLPDTFASKASACGEPYADNSVGNVTGSNSVNVFLGLGLPWMMGAIFWSAQGPTDEWKQTYPTLKDDYPDGGFIVKAGDLGFSVTVFLMCSLACLGGLVWRRKSLGGELGGPSGAKKATSGFYVALWFFYVGLSSWKTIVGEVSVGEQLLGICVGLASMLLLGLVVFVIGNIYATWKQKTEEKEAKKPNLQDIVLQLNQRNDEQFKQIEKLQALVKQAVADPEIAAARRTRAVEASQLSQAAYSAQSAPNGQPPSDANSFEQVGSKAPAHNHNPHHKAKAKAKGKAKHKAKAKAGAHGDDHQDEHDLYEEEEEEHEDGEFNAEVAPQAGDAAAPPAGTAVPPPTDAAPTPLPAPNDNQA